MCKFDFLKPKESINRLKDFDTLEDLQAWFELHKELRMESPNLCDDYSRESRALAEMDGHFLSTCLVYKGEVYGMIIFEDRSVYHIANSAIVTDIEGMWYVDLAFGQLIKLCDFYPGGRY